MFVPGLVYSKEIFYDNSNCKATRLEYSYKVYLF